MKIYLAFDISEKLLDAFLTAFCPEDKDKLKEKFIDGSIHNFNLTELLSKSKYTEDEILEFIPLIQQYAKTQADDLANSWVDPKNGYFIQNESTGSWLKPGADGLHFDGDLQGAAIFNKDSAIDIVKTMQEIFPEFFIKMIPVTEALKM